MILVKFDMSMKYWEKLVMFFFFWGYCFDVGG